MTILKSTSVFVAGVLALGLLLPAGPARGDDGAWSPSWGRFNLAGEVKASCQHQGALVAGGAFTSAGYAVLNRVARWDVDHWEPLGDGFGQGEVRQLVSYGDLLVAVGTFETSGASTVGNVAVWDGQTWSPLGEVALGSNVMGAAVYRDEIIIYGSFTGLGAQGVSYIARYDGNGWQPLGAGVDGQVLSVCDLEAQLLVTGAFTTAGGHATEQAAVWGGIAWSPVGMVMPGLPPLDMVYGPAGVFGVNWTNQAYKAAPDLSEWVPIGTGLTGILTCLEMVGDTVYAGGSFSGGGPISCNNVAVLEQDTWRPLGDGADGWVHTITGLPDQVVLAGAFSRFDGEQTYNLAGWADDHAVHYTGVGINGNLVSAFVEYNGDLVVGGSFNWAGDVQASSVARWRNGQWEPMGAGFSNNYPETKVWDLEVYQGDLYACGYMRYSDGEFVNNVARWNPVFGTWEAIHEDWLMNWNWGVYDMMVHDGLLVLAGCFQTHTDNILEENVAAWDGENLVRMGANLPGDSYMGALAVHDGVLWAGGGVTGDAPVPHEASLAWWNGQRWVYHPDAPNDGVEALASFGGRLWVGGAFQSSPGMLLPFLAATDGDTWTIPDAVPDLSVWDLAVHGDRLFVGGPFASIGGQAAGGVAAYDGAAWDYLDGGVTGGTGYVNEVHPTVDGVLVGGSFLLAGGYSSPRMAFWSEPTVTGVDDGGEDAPAPAATDAICAPNPFNASTTVSFAVSQAGPGQITVHDVRGHRVRRVDQHWIPTGDHRWNWDGRDEAGRSMPSGTYFITLTTPWQRTVGRAVMVK